MKKVNKSGPMSYARFPTAELSGKIRGYIYTGRFSRIPLHKSGGAGTVEMSQALVGSEENTGNAGRWFRVGRIRVGRGFDASTRPDIAQPDASAATHFPAVRQVPA